MTAVAGPCRTRYCTRYKALGANVMQTFCVSYSRQALDRCWAVIRKAAKEANPACIIWLSSHSPTHPHVVNSRMYQEIDWLMNEGGDIERVEAVKPMIGKHTRLPVVTTRCNGAAELLAEGHEGFILDDPADDGTLADRLRQLMDAAVRQRMGAAARRTALRYPLERNCAELLSIDRDAAESRQPVAGRTSIALRASGSAAGFPGAARRRAA